MEKRGVVEKDLTPCDCCCEKAEVVHEESKHACCGQHLDPAITDLNKIAQVSNRRITTLTQPVE